MNNTEDLIKMSNNDLQLQLMELHKEAFKLRLKKSNGELGKPHLLKNVRRNIARIKTIMAQKVEAAHV